MKLFSIINRKNFTFKYKKKFEKIFRSFFKAFSTKRKLFVWLSTWLQNIMLPVKILLTIFLWANTCLAQIHSHFYHVLFVPASDYNLAAHITHVVSVLILFVNGLTYNLKSIPNDRFFLKILPMNDQLKPVKFL